MFKIKKLIIILMIFLTSCKGLQFENKTLNKVEEFTNGELMIFVAEEKNKFENRFGNEIWNLKSGNGEYYFKDYVISNVKLFVEKLMKFKLIANDLNIILTPTDKNKLVEAAKKYYSSLTNADLDFIGCTQVEVLNAFNYYHISRLVIDRLTVDSTHELSISEAKVIKVQYIVLNDYETAKDVREKLDVKGASFSYYAKTRSEETDIEMIIKRGDEMSVRYPELFYLSEGQISDILQNINQYYIFKCIDDHMEEETEERRIEILKAMKREEFDINFKMYDEMYDVRSKIPYWKEIDLSLGENCKINKFEDIYYEYFPHSIQ